MTQSATITIEGMNCQHCVQSVTKALSGVQGVTDVKVDLAAKKAEVQFEPEPASMSQLIQKVNEAGFHATGFTRN